MNIVLCNSGMFTVAKEKVASADAVRLVTTKGGPPPPKKKKKNSNHGGPQDP